MMRNRVSAKVVSPTKGFTYSKERKKWRCAKEKRNVPPEEVLSSIKKNIAEEAAQPFCVSMWGSKTKCNCLHIFQMSPALISNVAKEILNYFEGDSFDQTFFFLNWKRNADTFKKGMSDEARGGAGRSYLILHGPTHFHCTSGVCRLLGMGREKYGRIINSDEDWRHGNTNNNNRNKRMLETFNSIDVFLSKVEEQADPISSRVVRDSVGVSLRGDTDAILLPPHMKYRKIYESWIWSRGWKIKWTGRCKTHYAPIDQWENRPHDTDEWPEGSVKRDICSWPTFLNQWALTHPKLRIRPAGEDTCSKCWRMAEELRGIVKTKTHAEGRVIVMSNRTAAAAEAATLEASNDDDDEDVVMDEAEDDDAFAERMMAEGELNAACHKYKQCLSKCHAHIRHYSSQRELLDAYVKLAKEDHANNVPLAEKTVVLVTDMMQKATVPWLASEQVDVAYYYSPKTQHISGWADCATETINIYAWAEGVAGSGANEICSCFYSELKMRRMLEEGSIVKHLVIAADNCGTKLSFVFVCGSKSVATPLK